MKERCLVLYQVRREWRASFLEFEDDDPTTDENAAELRERFGADDTSILVIEMPDDVFRPVIMVCPKDETCDEVGATFDNL